MVKTFASELHNIYPLSELGSQKKIIPNYAKDPFIKLQNISNRVLHHAMMRMCCATMR